MLKYDAKAAQETDRSYRNPEVENQRLKTIEALGLKAGERVLDVSCGTGLLSAFIYRSEIKRAARHEVSNMKHSA